MGSGEVHQVAVEPILAPHELSWYSDSNTLLATTSEGVWKLSVLGGKAERIYGPAFSAVASPDGKRLAITAWDRRSLWCAGSSGEDAHEIARLPEHSDGYLSRPAWSPHGKRIAYMEHWQDGQKIEAEIATVRPDGHDERVLLRRFPIMQIHWMADGRLLFGVGKGPLGYNNLWSVSVDEQTGRASSAEQPLTSWPDFRFGEPSSTSDGHTIVFVRAMPETDVYAADLARGAAEVGPLKRVTFGASYSYTYPAAWDLAENSLLIVVNDAGKLSIARQPLDSMAPSSVLASSDGLQYSPQFTADHKWIVWIRESHSNAEVLRMPRAGGAADVLDREPGQAFSLRCPMLAGQDCIFSAAQGDETIFRAVTPELGKSRELFRWKDLSGQLNFEVAPQGDRMLVCQAEQPKAAESDAGKVFLVDLPSGGNRRNLPFGCPANITWWSWLPSSKGWLLARITRSGTGGSELLRVDETGASTVLWSSKSQRLGEPVISPDGRHIAFASYGSERNVWALHF
jgi:Tol biopolymer transport system component